MLKRMRRSAFVVVVLGLLAVKPALAACAADGMQLQILGSGGTGARQPDGLRPATSSGSTVSVASWSTPAAASSSAFMPPERILGDVALLALSHLHPDHAAAVPALLWPRGSDAARGGPLRERVSFRRSTTG